MVPQSFVDLGSKFKGGNGPKWPKSGPEMEKDPLSGQRATYRKTADIQRYLRILGTYDPIESGLSEPKNWGFTGVA